MNQNRAIEDFTGNKDDEIVTIATSVIEGLTTNPNFIFTTQLTDLVSAVSTYSTKLGLVKTGNNTAATAKDNAKVIVEVKLAVISRAVNLQAHGDLIKLQSSGLPLVKLPSHHFMEPPIHFKVERSNIAGTMDLSVTSPNYGTYGTIFAFWKPEFGPTPEDINDWFMRHSNGLTISIKGLKINTPYLFAAAYKGLDYDPLVWTAIVTKSPGD